MSLRYPTEIAKAAYGMQGLWRAEVLVTDPGTLGVVLGSLVTVGSPGAATGDAFDETDISGNRGGDVRTTNGTSSYLVMAQAVMRALAAQSNWCVGVQFKANSGTDSGTYESWGTIDAANHNRIQIVLNGDKDFNPHTTNAMSFHFSDNAGTLTDLNLYTGSTNAAQYDQQWHTLFFGMNGTAGNMEGVFDGTTFSKACTNLPTAASLLAMYIGALNSGGTAGFFSNSTLGYISIHSVAPSTAATRALIYALNGFDARKAYP